MPDLAHVAPLPAEGPIYAEVDPELVDLIPRFLENRRREIEALREAVRVGDSTTV